MGAVPGIGFLTGAWFDVERFRAARGRLAVVRRVNRPALVLGSTQPASVVDGDRAARAGLPVLRRRSGGGAVLVVPGVTVWVDLWVPRDDRLWEPDVVRGAEWAGEWWADALAATGADGLSVHRGRSVAAPGSDLVCFAGVGPGEVLAGARKVVGLAQWRSREGALVHSCAYLRWEPAALVDVLAMPPGRRAALAASLARSTVGIDQLSGIDEVAPAGPERGARVIERLVESLPAGASWDVSTG